MLYEAEAGDITLAFAGDAMINRRLSPFREPHFLGLVELLRAADASIVNLEQLFHEGDMSWSGTETHSFQVSDPANLRELQWMGFDAVSTAMNHAYDYNEAGFLATLAQCKACGLPQAGGGMNLGESRAPAFVDTARGRVALLATCSTFGADARAGDGRPDFPGKPGINGLRHERVQCVPRETFSALQTLKQGLRYDEQEANARLFAPHMAKAYDEEQELHLFGQTFRVAETFGQETACNADDLRGICNWIRGAAKAADWVVYSVHYHESGFVGDYHGGSRVPPPDFLIEFAHAAIDRGCHVVTGHGSHFLRGIEIYNGRPIFYSLGNFIFQNETVQRVPPPGYALQHLGNGDTPGDWGMARSGDGEYGFAADPVFYQTIVPVCEFRRGVLAEIRCYPVDLGFGKPMSQRGRPLLASGESAQAILTWLQAVSRPYGTAIAIEGDIGIIRP
jgi:poly-gamma-glutamate capsule biosynthesis protein CapA/YwtB (metallophosphatase superfamily)